jgi:hypothetical protein
LKAGAGGAFSEVAIDAKGIHVVAPINRIRAVTCNRSAIPIRSVKVWLLAPTPHRNWQNYLQDVGSEL